MANAPHLSIRVEAVVLASIPLKPNTVHLWIQWQRHRRQPTGYCCIFSAIDWTVCTAPLQVELLIV